MSTPTQAAGRKRLVHHLDTPFSTISWPEISLDDQDVILELLCSFLSPLGQHRKAMVKPSKKERAARRGKKLAMEKAKPEQDVDAPAPVQPELEGSVDVGFNSIARNLQPVSVTQGPGTCDDADDDTTYSMVFVARGNQSPAFNCHFPQMVGVASKNTPADQRTRLVGFSKPCADRLSSVLALPRVSSVAVRRAAPGADALLAFVQQKVSPISVPWIEMSDLNSYRRTKIASVETVVGVRREKRARLGSPEGSRALK